MEVFCPFFQKSVDTSQNTIGPLRIYADGVFDLFHHGHAQVLEQARYRALELLKKRNETNRGIYLLVGVCLDEDTHTFKGPTVMTYSERCASVSHCRHVDEIIYDAPWIIDETFIEKYNIDYVAHDDIPYKTVGTDDAYGIVKSMGKFLTTSRTSGISTTDLITRVLFHSEEFTARNNLKREV
jgi:choline-phosphate cytidylyltransferase